MIKPTPNANFYSLKGDSKPLQENELYKEYRDKWIRYPQNMILREFPMHLDIEATSRCNLRCTFCDKLPLMKKNQIGDIDFGLYKKIIDEGAENGLWGVKLSYRGEPLLHPKIVDMVRYAKEKGILDVYFNTNAMLLDEKMCSDLIDAGLDRISISVGGTTAEKYEQERVGAKFDILIKNISMLKALKVKKGIEYPRVRVQTVFFADVDVEKYKAFWQDKCDEVAMLDYNDESNRQTGIVQEWSCPQIWQRMTIEWDGMVFPCNNNDVRGLVLGNAREDSMFECWNSEKANNIRKQHKKGTSHMIEDCDGCPWRTTQIKKMTK